MSSFPITETAENLWAETVTIKNGASAADAVCTQGHALVGIQMPAGWDAANIGYEVSLDNGTYQTAYDKSGNLEQATVAAARFIDFPLSDAIFGPYVRLKSVSNTNVAVNQTADRTLLLLFRRYQGGS